MQGISMVSCSAIADNKQDGYGLIYMVVAGGGAGSGTTSNKGGAGGGAGGILVGSRNITASEVLSITVGTGGAASQGDGANGTNSTLSGVAFGTLTALGGTGGKYRNVGTGGSGGGVEGTAYLSTYGVGTKGQGNNGSWGAAFNSGGLTSGGGGGYVSGGRSGTAFGGGAGGSPLWSTIDGINSRYSRGGDGTDPRDVNGYNGSVYGYGSGGSGSGYYLNMSRVGGTGANGVVILRMATVNYSGVYTGTPTVKTVETDTVLIFTSNGSYTLAAV